MSWLVAILGYLLSHVAHDLRVRLALHVAQRFHDALDDKHLSPRRLATLARLEDRFTRLVRAIVYARMYVLRGFSDYIQVDRKPVQRRATCVVALRRRVAFLVAVLGSVDAFCRRLTRQCAHARSRRRHTATPRRASRAIARFAGFTATLAPLASPALELSG